MIRDGSNNETPDREDISHIIAKDQVREAKAETEAVALARLKNDNVRFVIVAVSAAIMVVLVALFLIYIYPDSVPEVQGKIVTAATTIMSAAVGVFVGRVSAK